MSFNSYISSLASSIEKRVLEEEARTDTARDETQSEKEYLLAALVAIAIEAQERLRRGVSKSTVLKDLRNGWLEALQRTARSAFRKGAALRSIDTPIDINKATLKSKRLQDQIEFQSQFLLQFADEYVSGEMLEPRKMKFMNRAMLYALTMSGYYNMGAVYGGPSNVLIYWKLGACDHCTDCPALHVSGPYTKDTLPTLPGMGATKCGSWCCCHLVIVPNLSALQVAYTMTAGSGFLGLAPLPKEDKDEILDARLKLAFESRQHLEDEEDVYQAKIASLQADLDALVSGLEGYSETLPLGGPVIGLSQDSFSVIDEIYSRGIDSESLKMITIDVLDEFVSGAEDYSE